MATKKKRIIICGASASGKDFLKKKLIEAKFSADVSVTTRPMRLGETQKVEYEFLNAESFQLLIKEKKFFEYVQFNGWYYGTLQKSWNESQVFIMTPSAIGKLNTQDIQESYILYLDIDEKTRTKRLQTRKDTNDDISRRTLADRKDFELLDLKKVSKRITDPLFDAEELIDTLKKVLI